MSEDFVRAVAARLPSTREWGALRKAIEAAYEQLEPGRRTAVLAERRELCVALAKHPAIRRHWNEKQINQTLLRIAKAAMVAELRSRVHQQETEIAGLSAALDASHAAWSVLKNDAVEMRCISEELHAQLAAVETARVRLARQVEAVEAENRSLQRELDTAEATCRDLMRTVAELRPEEARADCLARRVARLDAELAAARDQHDTVTAALATAMGQLPEWVQRHRERPGELPADMRTTLAVSGLSATGETAAGYAAVHATALTDGMLLPATVALAGAALAALVIAARGQMGRLDQDLDSLARDEVPRPAYDRIVARLGDLRISLPLIGFAMWAVLSAAIFGWSGAAAVGVAYGLLVNVWVFYPRLAVLHARARGVPADPNRSPRRAHSDGRRLVVLGAALVWAAAQLATGAPSGSSAILMAAMVVNVITYFACEFAGRRLCSPTFT